MGSPKDEGGGGETTLRYAPYLESIHQTLINRSEYWGNSLLYSSPYATLTVTNPDEAFFGIGYTISAFPSLYDMFGKFMAGLDIEFLYDQEMTDTTHDAKIAELVAAEAAYLDDEINNISLPRMETGMRDMNAVMASGFIIGRELLEADRLKALNKFKAEMQLKAVELGHRRWEQHLQWNATIIETFMKINQLYFGAHHDYINLKGETDSRDVLWPFTIMDHQRVIIGTFSGATNQQISGDAKSISALSGMMGGAAIGASALSGSSMAVMGLAGGPLGAVAGGLLGLGASIF